MIAHHGRIGRGAGANAGEERFGMDGLFLLVGRLAGFVGVAACMVAVFVRLTGQYYLGTVSIGSVMQGGMAALLVACFCLLLSLSARGR